MTKILIADDAPELLDFFSILLQQKGYETQAAFSNKNLITKILLFAPDVILLDMGWMGINARNYCGQIKENPLTKHIPIILLSTDPSLLKNYAEYKADNIIEKPFGISTVYETINNALGFPRSLQLFDHTVSTYC